MSAETLVAGALQRDARPAPARYLSASMAVARSARRGEYVLVLPGSGTYFRTDRLGALTARALMRGRSDADVARLVDAIEPGAGLRTRELIGLLEGWSAISAAPRSGVRWRLRLIAASGIGLGLSVLGAITRAAPAWMLAWAFRIWPRTPIAGHVWRCSRLRILINLRSSGYADRPERWMSGVGRACAAEPSRNYLFNYVSVAIPAHRLDRLVEHLFEPSSLAALASRLQMEGPVVAVFLHGPLCVAVPNALRTRGLEVIRVIVPRTHGINLAAGSGRLHDFFGESGEMAVEENDPQASGALLRHLKAGRSVYVALDKLAEGKAARIEMLGHSLARNDAPALLAVHSRRPIMLWTTSATHSGVVIAGSPLVHADPSLPAERRVADVSRRLYALAESAIRAHPEAWTCWADLSLLEGGAA